MLRNLIILPDGTELTSGVGQINNIRSCTLTECVNSGEELTLGSTCAAMMEVVVQTPMGALSLTTGDEVTLYKVDEAGTRHKVGLFTLEKPTRTSAHMLKLTGYDRITRLDKDLTLWLKALDGWPYDLLTFARMVCEACGLTLVTESIPNGSVPVYKLSKVSVTGRQLMRWIGEVCMRFCRANADGDIELAWYTPSGVHLTPSGENYYYARSLTYEDYQVEPIVGIQIVINNEEYGYLWPEADFFFGGDNTYVVRDNPIFEAVRDGAGMEFETLEADLPEFTYRPCKVSFPARLDIRAGQTVEITNANGVTFTACVMTRTQKGQRDTIECTGSARRDSTTAKSNSGEGALDDNTSAHDTYLGDPSTKTAIRGSEIVIGGKAVSWVDNGDGTFSMVGIEVTT